MGLCLGQVGHYEASYLIELLEENNRLLGEILDVLRPKSEE